MYFVLLKVYPAKYAKKKFLKPEFCEKTSMAICAIFDDGAVNNRPLRAEAILAQKKFILKNFKKSRWSPLL